MELAATVVLMPRPSAARVFDAHAARYDAWFGQGPGRVLFPAELEAVRILFRRLPPPSLDIGVGTGVFAQELAVTIGIDPAPGALRIARSRGVEVAVALGEALPFRDASFGAVLLVVTLCFLVDPFLALREVVRVLRPDGGVVVAEIPRDSPWGWFYCQKSRAGHLFYRHAHFLSLAEAEQLLRQAGLEPVAYSSAVLQHPTDAPAPEEAHDGLVEGASFVCMLARTNNRPA